VILEKVYQVRPWTPSRPWKRSNLPPEIEPCIDDIAWRLKNDIQNGKSVIVEGPGTLLDIDFGTYRSSPPRTPRWGNVHGARIGPRSIDRIVGLAKAYTTRVATGLFPLN